MIPREEYGMDLLWWRCLLDDLASSDVSYVDLRVVSRDKSHPNGH